MPEKMLELVDYHFYYGQIHAIKGISLHVDKGEYVAMREARTHAAWYMRGLRGAARLRRECCALEHYEDLARIIDLAWQLQREGA